jgi:phage FluMu protein Com
MSDRKLTCSQCAATIRYADRHAGTSAKCPRCKTDIAIPADEDEIILGGEEDAPVRLAEAPTNFCVDCGKSIKDGIRRCKACRVAAKAQLESRMRVEGAYDKAMETQVQWKAKRRRPSGAWKYLHVLIIILTCGAWAPFYYFWLYPDDDD